MSQINDAMAETMLTEILISIPAFAYEDLNDITYQWLKLRLSLAGTVHSTIDDLWGQLFDLDSVPPGSYNDRYSFWLVAQGYIGALPTQKYNYWTGAEPIGAYWVKVMTPYWNTVMTALWNTTMDTEV